MCVYCRGSIRQASKAGPSATGRVVVEEDVAGCLAGYVVAAGEKVASCVGSSAVAQGVAERDLAASSAVPVAEGILAKCASLVRHILGR